MSATINKDFQRTYTVCEVCKGTGRIWIGFGSASASIGCDECRRRGIDPILPSNAEVEAERLYVNSRNIDETDDNIELIDAIGWFRRKLEEAIDQIYELQRAKCPN